MQIYRATHGADAMSATLASAGALFARRTAAENASRIANAACLYALCLNQTWLEILACHLDEYLELPKRYLEVQADLMNAAFVR